MNTVGGDSQSLINRNEVCRNSFWTLYIVHCAPYESSGKGLYHRVTISFDYLVEGIGDVNPNGGNVKKWLICRFLCISR